MSQHDSCLKSCQNGQISPEFVKMTCPEYSESLSYHFWVWYTYYQYSSPVDKDWCSKPSCCWSNVGLCYVYCRFGGWRTAGRRCSHYTVTHWHRTYTFSYTQTVTNCLIISQSTSMGKKRFVKCQHQSNVLWTEYRLKSETVTESYTLKKKKKMHKIVKLNLFVCASFIYKIKILTLMLALKTELNP